MEVVLWGDYEFTVPYTANYKLSLAGTQGSNYNSGAGGCGWSLVRDSIKLEYGDVVSIHVPAWDNTYDKDVASGGEYASLSVQGNVVWVAGGGAATVTNKIAQDGVWTYTAKGGAGNTNGTDSTYDVHWHTGNGKSGATHANQFLTVTGTANPGGCYTKEQHKHNMYGVTCPSCSHYRPAVYTYCDGTMVNMGHRQSEDGFWHTESKCDTCGNQVAGDEGGGRCGKQFLVTPGYYEHDYDCGDSPTNVWDLDCLREQGEICDINNDNTNAGSCYFATGWAPSSQIKSNDGAAYFKIELLEQQELFYHNTRVLWPYYVGESPVYLLIKDKRVVYFKRP